MNRIAILMPGQGKQCWGIGHKLYKASETTRKVFEQANDVLGIHFENILFAEKHEEIMETKYAQIAIFLTSVAYYKEFIENNQINACCIAGHSVGEYAALTCAGALTFEDGLRLVEKRGRYMQECYKETEPGAMAAVFEISNAELQEQCIRMNRSNKPITISNYNSENELVISGLESNVDEMIGWLTKVGAVVKKLKAVVPFHSMYMKEAADQMRKTLKTIAFSKPKYTVMSNLIGKPYEESMDIREMLALQIEKPVLWNDIMEYMLKSRIDYFIELGESHVLANLMRKNHKGICVRCFDTDQSKAEFQMDLRENKHIGRNYKLRRMLGIAVATKNRGSEYGQDWDMIRSEYSQMDLILEKVEQEERIASAMEVDQSYNHLRKLLRLKQLPEKEIERRTLELEI